MSQAVVLDASVLIAAMSAADAHHESARSILRRGAIGSALHAHPMTIAETAVGAARLNRVDPLRHALRALGVATVEIDDEQPWRLAQLRARTGLPLPDCCVLDTATSLSGRLATFDQRLRSAAERVGVTVVE